LRAHAPSDLGTSDDNGDTASNFSRRCREPVVARYQHWGRLASDFWRCKAVLDDLDVGVLDTLPDDERDRGSVLSVRAACSACERVNVHVRVCVCVCVCVGVCSAQSAKHAHNTPDSSAVSDSHEIANGPTTAIRSSFVAQRYVLFACTCVRRLHTCEYARIRVFVHELLKREVHARWASDCAVCVCVGVLCV
jgi:hypothetical protein